MKESKFPSAEKLKSNTPLSLSLCMSMCMCTYELYYITIPHLIKMFGFFLYFKHTQGSR